MEPNQAAEQLQAIRTLMERSAVYRRALAPIMIYCGIVGIIGGIVGDLLPLHESRRFVIYWTLVAILALIGTLLLVRRQAFKDSEPFWSPPTRRVTQALIPGLLVGAFAGWILACKNPYWYECRYIVPCWCILFGLAIHSASFFMPRGLQRFSWIFLITGALLFMIFAGNFIADSLAAQIFQPHWLMGLTFGGLHLAYGIYLYFTEKRGQTS